MRLLKRIIIAISLYSRIPMPQFKWDEDDMKHAVIFLPLVGLIIGVLETVAYYAFSKADMNSIIKIAIYSIIPLAITGGFHIDGFLDVEDALKSYKSKEEKLIILKDPHVGAFAIIRFLMYVIIWGAGMSIIIEAPLKIFIIYALSFFEVRAIAGLLSITLRHAKKDGMLNMETSCGITDRIFLAIEVVLGAGIMMYMNIVLAVIVIIALGAYVVVYRIKMFNNFGGITGDTIGYFITVAENMVLCVLALGVFFL